MTHSAYEPGMEIAFDPKARNVTVAFRGRVRTFPTMMEDEAEARMAAEAFCRELGWIPKMGSSHPRAHG